MLSVVDALQFADACNFLGSLKVRGELVAVVANEAVDSAKSFSGSFAGGRFGVDW